MHVSSYQCDRQRRPWRVPVAAALVALLAGFAGSAQAVEFDEKLKAPMVKNVAALRTQAQSFSAKAAAVQAASPQDLIANRALYAERFDLIWQIQQAIDTHRALGDLSAVGIESREDGSYHIDYNAAPQWQRFDELLAVLLPQSQWEALRAQLTDRGFREEDFAKLKDYVAAHDARKASMKQSLPLAVSFSKIVKKYDRIKRPVDDGLVLSYLYQRTRLDAEATREWADGLLKTLDAQRARILLAYFAEMRSTGVWAPSDQAAGIADLLQTMRLPNYESLATAEAAGGTP